MIKKYYSCKLLTNLVLNKSLATSGNMESLDYIPGSNFLGITAKALYAELSNEEAYAIFHAGDVCFGDATVAIDNEPSYAAPLSFFRDKNKDEPVYLHHNIENIKIKDVQLKQVRGIYMNSKGNFVSEINKSFSLKSAQDRFTGASADGQMFGFEAIEAGQTFLFSVVYKNEGYIKIVEQALMGVQRLGKSKNAEYGQVHIAPMENVQGISMFEKKGNFVLVYAESHLAFFDETFGTPTFTPSVSQLGLENGSICWEKSQIRTFAYAPWNGIRNTASTARHCISKGSVFYVENAVVPAAGNYMAGAYQAEGLGRIVFNPSFLQSTSADGYEAIALNKVALDKNLAARPVRNQHAARILNYLIKKHDSKRQEERIAAEVHNIVYGNNDADKKYRSFLKISSSQWGVVRNCAQYASNTAHLEEMLFKKAGDDDMRKHNKTSGLLYRGVAYSNYWGVQKDKNINLLKTLISSMKKELGDSDSATLIFVEKLASEIAKKISKK